MTVTPPVYGGCMTTITDEAGPLRSHQETPQEREKRRAERAADIAPMIKFTDAQIRTLKEARRRSRLVRAKRAS
jgi:hypothetical protein